MIELLQQKAMNVDGSERIDAPQISTEMLDLKPNQIDKLWVIESLELIRLEFNRRAFGEVVSGVGFYSEVLTQILFTRFTGHVKNAFIFNLIQSVLSCFFPDAVVQERDEILGSRTWRWSQPARTISGWLRSVL